MKVYVAGAPLDVERAERWIKRLRERGVIVVSQWPEVVRMHGENPRSVTGPVRLRRAHDRLCAVGFAEVLWMLSPPADHQAREAWLEVGFAERASIPLVFSGDTKQSECCAMGAEFDTDDAAFEHVMKLAGAIDRTPE